MTTQPAGSHRAQLVPQRVDAPLTASAVFLVVTVNGDAAETVQTVRSALAGLDDLVKTVGFRDLNGHVSCTAGIGSKVWDAVVGLPKPAELHPFQAVQGPKHTAVSTPGDVLFHIRAERRDLCFELERQLLASLGDAVTVVDETVGFRYFDNRDLLGFVDGTANPTGTAVDEAVLVAADDDSSSPAAPGGSYVVVQKYVHDMTAWTRLRTEEQEAIIGRTKLDNVELPDADGATVQRSHKTLNTVESEGGELEILRDNMPFGSPGSGEFGTYFIGYTRRLWVLETMLKRMFSGDPPGLHDRLLDYSTALTGSVFFVPASGVLAGLE
ncbi:dyp-type peroxidase family protein [Grosmannia clavigera kw1407]|uniref:Dyp-type peroxidase family protein n=1 Tax=Grosmannia clavigera (strain kw1407 / UAMH 11150) TaxID=655863 RepID=F0XL64_GROCL|nr:dyp-type peroxidase family protein [Grosmannia clavigera kw1407]EFX01839.1 dyp-type peroxidase family protein [Grosmannia clavigera kw1407]